QTAHPHTPHTNVSFRSQREPPAHQELRSPLREETRRACPPPRPSLASEERVDRFRRGIYNGCSARAAHREERSSPQLFVRSLRLSISPPQTDADAGGSRPNQRDPDADELGLHPRHAVTDGALVS